MFRLKGQMSTALSFSLVAAATFFVIIPYSSTLRPAYIHLLFNLLIVALGSAESGILRVFTKSTCDASDVHQPIAVGVIDSPAAVITEEFNELGCENKAQDSATKMVSEMICSPLRLETALVPNAADEDVEEDAEEISEAELFIRAEEFIENFYKQLKMQREESLSNLQDLPM